MGIEGIGSSVVIALAAVLWLVYLIPTWFRRREYLSTERNAVRLQQTIRILAETAETPDAVRADTTARSVAAQQRLVKHEAERQRAIERARDAAMSRAAAHTLATLKPAVAADVVAHSPAARRLRRARAATTCLLALGLASASLALTPVAAAVTTPLLAGSGIVIVGGVVALRRMAAVAARRAARVRELRTRVPMRAQPLQVFVETPVERASTEWTPIAVPKPLYLSRPTHQRLAEPAAIAPTAAEPAASEPATKEPGTGEPRPVEHTAIVSPFARMGYLEAPTERTTDLDDVLRRRRAV